MCYSLTPEGNHKGYVTLSIIPAPALHRESNLGEAWVFEAILTDAGLGCTCHL